MATIAAAASLSLLFNGVAVAVPTPDAAGTTTPPAGNGALLDATAFSLRAREAAARARTWSTAGISFGGPDEIPPARTGRLAGGELLTPLASVGQSTSRYIAPVPGPITSAFGPRFHPILHYVRNHNGVDMTASCGTPVVATASGQVTRAAWAGGYGNLVEVNHGVIDSNRVSTRYAHLSALAVQVGQHVNQGQVIGLAGTTGLSTGCHLHFEVIMNGSFVDPAAVLAGAPIVKIQGVLPAMRTPAVPLTTGQATLGMTTSTVAAVTPSATPSATGSATATPTPIASASATPTPTVDPTTGTTPTPDPTTATPSPSTSTGSTPTPDPTTSGTPSSSPDPSAPAPETVAPATSAPAPEPETIAPEPEPEPEPVVTSSATATTSSSPTATATSSASATDDAPSSEIEG